MPPKLASDAKPKAKRVKTTTSSSSSKNNNNNDGNNNARDAAAKSKYQALNQRDHLLKRPDMVLGSVERTEHPGTRMFDPSLNRMVYRDATYSGALLQVIQELLTNAGDREFKGDPVRLIEIEVPSVEESHDKPIVVRNDGNGIPVLPKRLDDDVGGGEFYIPEICFGHFRAGENFDDDEVRWCGGRNGIGAKACNVYSRRFTVRVKDPLRQKQFEQEFWDNMGERSKPKVRVYRNKSGMVEVSMLPDYARFGHADQRLDETTRALIITRAYDLAACTGAHIRVKLNGVDLKVRGMQQYADLVFGADRKLAPRVFHRQEVPFTHGDGSTQNVARLEVALAHADPDRGAHVIGFVNALPCNLGKHVQHLADKIASETIKYFKDRKASAKDQIDASEVSESGAVGSVNFCDYSKLRPVMIRNNMSLVVKVLVDNPSFTSQSKEELATAVGKWGFRVQLPANLPQQVQKLGIVRSAMYEAAAAQQKALGRAMTIGAGSSGGRLGRRPDVPKLDDAHNAGKPGEHNVLILIEGDSAKEMTLAGVSVVGKDNYGVFPLRGKMINVRQASMDQLAKNADVQNLCKIMGVRPGQPVESPQQMRYQQIFMLTDADVDGAHIAGLIINAIQTLWPRVAADPSFFVRFRTPIRVARLRRKRSDLTNDLFFLTEPEYETWLDSGCIPPVNLVDGYDGEDNASWANQVAVVRDNLANRDERLHVYRVEYLKGLGSSSNKMAIRYFRYLRRFVVKIDCSETRDGDLVRLAFAKMNADERKRFVDLYDAMAHVDYNRDHVGFADFLRGELAGFWHADCVRSIPKMVDGLKPGQRKALFALMMRRSPHAPEKVSILASEVGSRTAYHHGEASMIEALVTMAQNHLGTNNLNLLYPQGQFGSRLFKRDVHSAPRYIYSFLEHVATALFPRDDFDVLLRDADDGKEIEPFVCAPIVPLVLINGADGIGTGYSTFVPSFRPLDVLRLTRSTLEEYCAFLDAERPDDNDDDGVVLYSIGRRGWLPLDRENAWIKGALRTDDVTAMEVGDGGGGDDDDDAAVWHEGLPVPWYDLFEGTVTANPTQANQYVVRGRFERLPDGKHVRVTELPIGEWKDPWRTAVVDKNRYFPAGTSTATTAATKRRRATGNDASSSSSSSSSSTTSRAKRDTKTRVARGFVIDLSKDDSTHVKVDVTLRCDPAQLAKMSDAALIKALRLQTTLSTNNMYLWNRHDALQRYANVLEIVRAFVVMRYYVYELRKAYKLARLRYDSRVLLNRYKFLKAFVEHRIEIRDRTAAQIVTACEQEQLERLQAKFHWQHPDAEVIEATLEQGAADDGANEDDASEVNAVGSNDDDDDDDDDENKSSHSVERYDGFDYLLGQNLSTLSRANLQRLEARVRHVQTQIEELRDLSVANMWRADLAAFEVEHARFLARKEDCLQNNAVAAAVSSKKKKTTKRRGAKAGK